MFRFVAEKYLAPGDTPEADGFRPTTEKTRIARQASRIDQWSDRLMWGGIALVTVLTASLTAWSSAELLSTPYGDDACGVWWLGLGLGLVADTLWIIMLLLVRRARANLRTNYQAERAGWGFAAVSVFVIAGHALIDGAGIRSLDDFTLKTVVLLVFSAFPILTKVLWTVLLSSFYLPPDEDLAKELDNDARRLEADRLRLIAQGDNARMRQLLTAERQQLNAELGLDERDTERPRVDLSRDDQHDTTPRHRDTGHDTTTPRYDATVPVLPRGPRRDTTRHTPAIDTNTPPTRPAPVTPAAAQHPQPQPQPRKAPGRSGQPSVKQVILEALRDGVDVDDKTTLRARVEQTLGPIKEKAEEGEVKADTWRTSYRRAVKEVEEGTGQYL